MEIFQSRVKEERPDEAEIKALAAKIVEANKKPQSLQKTAQIFNQNRGSILCYFPKLNGCAVEMHTTDATQNENRTPDDGPSVKGQFCWNIVGKSSVPVPCILKNDGTKYVSVRIAESKVLSHFFQRLNTEVFNCVSVKSFSITEAETKLLNEINTKQCDYAFGKEVFNINSDFIVKLEDLMEFYSFMETCYNKLLHSPSNGVNKCGFVRINDDSVVPYAVKNDQQYVPLFYFEGETESLKTKAINLENWDLAYLKFCCKVQGIKNELFASEQCQVTSLEDVKSYFPEGTKFDEYWPTKLLDMQTPTRNDMNGNHSWVQTPHIEPSVPQTVPSSHAMVTKSIAPLKQMHTNQRVNTTVINNASGAVPLYQNNSWPTAIMGTTNSAQTGTYQVAHQMTPVVQPRAVQKQNSNSNLHSINTNFVSQPVRSHAPQYYSTAPNNVPNATGATQQPPPLVRVTTANVPNTYATVPGETYAHIYNNSMPPLYTTMGITGPHAVNSVSGTQNSKVRGAAPNQTNVSNVSNVNRYPPALTPINSNTNLISSNNGIANNVSNVIPNARPLRANFSQNGGEIIDLSSPPHSPQSTTNHVALVRPSPVPNSNNINFKSNNFRNTFPPLVSLSDPTAQQLKPNLPPFKAQTMQFRDKPVLAMNLRPYSYTDYVMTLPDVITHFFPQVLEMDKMRNVMQNILKMTLYKGSTMQMQVLGETQKYKQLDEEVPLVLLSELERLFPQLVYMEPRIRGADNIDHEAKRQKIS